MPFDPTKHLTSLGSKGDYLETKWRLVWLYDANPDTPIQIATKLEEHEIGKRAVFSAHVIVGNREATGWAIKEQRGGVSYLENAETHALGRALAALGYGTQFCDEYADGSDADGITPVDSPIHPRNRVFPKRHETIDAATGEITGPAPDSPPEAPTAPPAAPERGLDATADPLDIERLLNLWTQEAGQSVEALEKLCVDRYDRPLLALTHQQCAALMTKLTAQLAQRAKPKP